MQSNSQRLEELIQTGKRYLLTTSTEELSSKPNPEKWSKKEILGHLVDSAINNLQRFTEIQFEPQPYPIRKYNQDGLVEANRYQEAELEELLSFWLSLNKRIQVIMSQQTNSTLELQILLGEGQYSDLAFLMKDYIDHLEYHLKQIMR